MTKSPRTGVRIVFALLIAAVGAIAVETLTSGLIPKAEATCYPCISPLVAPTPNPRCMCVIPDDFPPI